MNQICGIIWVAGWIFLHVHLGWSGGGCMVGALPGAASFLNGFK